LDKRVKVRIGIGLGGAGGPDGFADAVDHLEAVGVDSLWLPEMVYGPLVEPFIGMAHALSRTSRLKVGSGLSVLPGRHPVLVAKQLASLAGLAPARVLPVFGLRPARPAELAVFQVPPGRRGAVFDESLALLRLLLRQEGVSFQGEFFTVEDASVGPLPAKPLDIWLGGSGPDALRRVGRLGDGWLASLLAPEEAAAGRLAIQEAADAAGREVEPDHFGLSSSRLCTSGGRTPIRPGWSPRTGARRAGSSRPMSPGGSASSSSGRRRRPWPLASSSMTSPGSCCRSRTESGVKARFSDCGRK
jgi:probable F420-dependent oxidoreductase